MAICDRCESPVGVRIDDRCDICGPIPLCPDCYSDHTPNET